MAEGFNRACGRHVQSAVFRLNSPPTVCVGGGGKGTKYWNRSNVHVWG